MNFKQPRWALHQIWKWKEDNGDYGLYKVIGYDSEGDPNLLEIESHFKDGELIQNPFTYRWSESDAAHWVFHGWQFQRGGEISSVSPPPKEEERPIIEI